MENVLFIIPREDCDSRVTAVLTAQVDEVKLTDEHNFLEALMEGLADWVNKTADGKKFWKLTDESFNIEDLFAQQPFSHLLKKHLQRHGIFGMKIQKWTPTSDGHWQYDDTLIDKQRLKG